jgi:chromatin remodeling complex protein RSC6
MPPAKKTTAANASAAKAPKSKATKVSTTPTKTASKASEAKAKVADSNTTTASDAPAVEIVGSAVVADSQENQLSDEFTAILAEMTSLRSSLSALTTRMRGLQKRTEREIKVAQKAGKKKKSTATGDRKPSGFVKPALITNQLAAFLGKPSGTEMARTDVTREINAYIRQNNLQDPTNGRRIIPDASLGALLNVGASDELTYFNLQRYMSPHFIKASA